MGALLLRCNMDLRTFLWNNEIGFICCALNAKELSPDLMMGHVNVLKICMFTCGLSIHLYAKAGPSKLYRLFLPL